MSNWGISSLLTPIEIINPSSSSQYSQQPETESGDTTVTEEKGFDVRESLDTLVIFGRTVETTDS